MKKTEKLKLREVFNEELIKYSDVLFSQFCNYEENECYVELTEDILNFIEEYEIGNGDYRENYSSSIGEIIYMSLNGEPIFPLSNFKTYIDDMGVDKVTEGFQFYTLYDMNDLVINSISDKKGFSGIIDSFTHINYDNFYDLFIYSMLKFKNKK